MGRGRAAVDPETLPRVSTLIHPWIISFTSYPQTHDVISSSDRIVSSELRSSHPARCIRKTFDAAAQTSLIAGKGHQLPQHDTHNDIHQSDTESSNPTHCSCRRCNLDHTPPRSARVGIGEDFFRASGPRADTSTSRRGLQGTGLVDFRANPAHHSSGFPQLDRLRQ